MSTNAETPTPCLDPCRKSEDKGPIGARKRDGEQSIVSCDALWPLTLHRTCKILSLALDSPLPCVQAWGLEGDSQCAVHVWLRPESHLTIVRSSRCNNLPFSLHLRGRPYQGGIQVRVTSTAGHSWGGLSLSTCRMMDSLFPGVALVVGAASGACINLPPRQC